MNKKPNVFDYLDYRKYLKDYYEYMKSTIKRFSFRSFARSARLNSENYLKLVIDGDVNLSRTFRNKFAIGCDLNKEEKEFFFMLIDFTDEKGLKARNRHLKKLNALSVKYMQKEIGTHQQKVLAKWYYVVVRALVTLEDFKPDPKYMARKLRGYISPKEAAEAFDVLLETGLVVEKEGKYVLVEKHIASRDEVQIAAGRNFHAQMIPVGITAIKKNALADREIRALTIGIDEKKAIEAKKLIKDFYKELVGFLSTPVKGSSPGDVWQLNLQFFKYTKKGAD